MARPAHRDSRGTPVRPTPDRVRETVFNWLRGSLVGARCLDLFAGTGVLGFEALSRGAAEAWFVEQDAQLVDALTRPRGSSARRRRSCAATRSRSCASRRSARFDVVFLDPPYAAAARSVARSAAALAHAAAVVYVERPRSEGLPAVPAAAWLKQSYAGAVEYGLLRFEEATMPANPPSEAHST